MMGSHASDAQIRSDIIMNTLFLAALSAATLPISAAPANATVPTNPAGHWQWQHTAQYGPRAALTASHRVWIADPAAMAASDCAKMAKAISSADCMAMMDAPPAATG
jgi:hypothetical protein